MANPSVETVNTSGDKLMLTAGVLLVLAGFVGFFWLSGQEWYVRGVALAVGVIAECGSRSPLCAPGKVLLPLPKIRTKKSARSVWPTRKEATQDHVGGLRICADHGHLLVA